MKSIRRRILVPLVPTLVAALLLAAWGIERSVRGDLLRALDARLAGLGQVVASAIDVEEDGQVEFQLDPGAVPETRGDEPSFAYAVHEDREGTLAASLPPPHTLPDGAPYGDTSLGDRPFRTYTVAVARAVEGAADGTRPRRFTVTVGLSTGEVRAALATVRARLAIAFSFLLVVLCLVPTAIVARAMRPLRRLSREATAVGPQRPAARLDAAGADEEVRALVVAVNEALGRLAAALAREKALTADTAHELRAPLASIRAHCEVALRRPRGAEELRATLETVHRTTVRLAAVAEKLLALARLEGGAAPLRRDRANLAQAARDAVRLHVAAAAAKGVHLETHLPELLEVTGDEALLAESVSNLVENAVQHTGAGGHVRIAGGLDEGSAAIAVEDTGEGIPPEYLATVFDRFYRVDAARTPGQGGAGLGLAIARRIGRLHGGDITVSSEPGHGSRFELRVPLWPGAPRAPQG